MISARQLTKHFRGPGGKDVVAVSDLTMDVAEGSLTAFLGPNGAGKSTSLRLLTTLLAPTDGSARVCGFDIVTEPEQVRARLGYVGQKNGAGLYQRVRDELVSQGMLYGLGRAETRRRVDEAVDALDLGEVVDRKTMQLSGGQKRRVDIALGLIPAPRLLFLDEPSTGLDPQSRAHLWEHILELRRRYGMTLFLTTHYLDEADQFAERVMIVDHGRIIADDTAPHLKANLAGDRITLTMAGPWDGADELVHRAARATGVGPPTIQATPTANGARAVVHLDSGDRALPHLIRELQGAGRRVLAADLARPTLDDVFLNLTGRSLREEGRHEPVPEQPQTAGVPR
ncbi:ATP-binding cassette domain-containing protein [Georgenia yuyongxinii]|uniref:ATP-binding cassette domain-containing protein n=1 Tax=Georgenia yuyongxinii TaxID=2589797 RepID=A0A5B8C8S6_9MICO|nr:ATP-binding cassette domain-containing protein [Georgenia yuyongxinii]